MEKAKAARSKIGRPSSFTDEVADIICAELAQGKPLSKVCQAPDMPSLVTVYNWLHNNEGFLKKYTRAKEESADTLADQLLEIADDASLDPNDKRVRIDARKWIASKMKPKKYGDKTALVGDTDDGSIKIHIIKGDDDLCR